MYFTCNETVSLPMKPNIERHFLTIHKNYEKDFPRGPVLGNAKVQQLI